MLQKISYKCYKKLLTANFLKVDYITQKYLVNGPFLFILTFFCIA